MMYFDIECDVNVVVAQTQNISGTWRKNEYPGHPSFL